MLLRSSPGLRARPLPPLEQLLCPHLGSKSTRHLPCSSPRRLSLTHALEDSPLCSKETLFLKPSPTSREQACPPPESPPLPLTPRLLSLVPCSLLSLLPWLGLGPLRPQKEVVPARVWASPAGARLHSCSGHASSSTAHAYTCEAPRSSRQAAVGSNTSGAIRVTQSNPFLGSFTIR